MICDEKKLPHAGCLENADLENADHRDHFSFQGGRGRVHDFEYEQRFVYDFTKRGTCYANSQNTGLDLASHQLCELVPLLRPVVCVFETPHAVCLFVSTLISCYYLSIKTISPKYLGSFLALPPRGLAHNRSLTSKQILYTHFDLPVYIS